MPASVEQIVSYALVVSGLAIVGATIIRMIRRRVTIDAASRVVVQLLKAGNIDRAAKLCGAAPGTFLDAVAAAIAVIPPTTRDRTTLAALIDEAFEATAKKLVAAWNKRVQLGFVGTILVGGGVLFAATGAGTEKTLEVLAGLGAIGTLWIGLHKGHTEQALAIARKDIMPALVDAAAASPLASAS